MASTAFTSAGTTLSISADLPATEDQAGYEDAGITYTEIGEITDVPEFGKTYNLVTHNPLGTRNTVKRKGSYNNGSVALQMAKDPADAGQIIALSALDSDENHTFKVAYADGSTEYFQAQVLSYTSNVGSVDSITSASVQLEITTDVVYVAAP